jgi:hypothetical protein
MLAALCLAQPGSIGCTAHLDLLRLADRIEISPALVQRHIYCDKNGDQWRFVAFC